MITVHTTREDSQQYDADQGVIGKDGTLTLYKWLSIGRYRCPLHRTIVTTFAPGKWANFSPDKDSECD